MNDIFVDVLGNVVVTGGVVRLEFVRLSGVDQATKKPKFELSHRVVMPMEGFLRSLALQEGLRKKLVDDGLVKIDAPAEDERGKK